MVGSSFLRFAGALAFAFDSVFLVNAFSYSETGQTITVNGINYYAPAKPVSSLTGFSKIEIGSNDDLLPLTVITAQPEASTFSTEFFEQTVKNFTDQDDVFNTGFLNSVYLLNQGTPCQLLTSFEELFSKFQSRHVYASQFTSGPRADKFKSFSSEKTLPSGPYFLNPATGEIYRAYRLYSDVQGAFTVGTFDNGDGTFSAIDASVAGSQSPTIGVPSRLYYTKTQDKPLAGVRLGIKDIYNIAGLKTSCGNRAYFELYPPANASAPTVQRLIDAGAVIVGKMKTSQFANGETATADWVDYHAPFNARGDGYQDPSSSSAGPGAGCGAYDWLDLTVGSDTGGSIRNPAQVNGCFGNRPSMDLVSLDGVMPMSPALDTPGFITRDPYIWSEAAKAMYQNNITTGNFKSFPKKIHTAGFPTKASTEAERILLEWTQKLESFLNTNASQLDYTSKWNANPPKEADNSKLDDYMNLVYPVLISQQQWEKLTTPFYEDYAAIHPNSQPPVDPAVLIRWDWGQNNVTSSLGLDEQLKRRSVFAEWWEHNAIRRDSDTCSDSILLYPGTLAQTAYRNQYKSAPGIPTGFDYTRIGNLAAVPDMVVPVGQAPYNSTVTNSKQYLPVAIDIIAAAGCDGMIFELVKQLAEAGIVQKPKAGSLLY